MKMVSRRLCRSVAFLVSLVYLLLLGIHPLAQAAPVSSGTTILVRDATGRYRECDAELQGWGALQSLAVTARAYAGCLGAEYHWSEEERLFYLQKAINGVWVGVSFRLDTHLATVWSGDWYYRQFNLLEQGSAAYERESDLRNMAPLAFLNSVFSLATSWNEGDGTVWVYEDQVTLPPIYNRSDRKEPVALYHAIVLGGMSADLEAPLMNDFVDALWATGDFAEISSGDYWAIPKQHQRDCFGPCKVAVMFGEWTRMNTATSQEVAAQVLQPIRDAQANGTKVMLIGHSMGATLAANIALTLQKEGVTVDSLVFIGPAVTDSVRGRLRDADIRVSEYVNGCDRVPELAREVTFNPWHHFQLLMAAADEACHQSEGYYSSGALAETMRHVEAAR